MPLDLSGLDVSGLNSLFPQKPKRNPIVAGVSAGVDNLQELGYNAAAAVSDAVGLNRAREWLLDRAALNQDEAYANGRPDLEMVEDQDLGSALPFAAYQISKQLPQIGAALGLGAVAPAAAIPAGLTRGAAYLPRAIGGGGARAGMDFAARRAAIESGNTFARNLTGGMALGSAMGAGSMYGESVEAGDPSPYAALAAAPLYGVTEGLPTALLGGTLTKGAFRGSMPTRMLKAGAVNAGTGATSELAQNEMEMAFNPTLSEEEMFSRRLNAGVVGGLAEGTLGSLGGIRRPPEPVNLLPGANGSQQQPIAPPAPPLAQMPPALDPYAQYGETGTLFGGQPDFAPMDAPPAPDGYNDYLRDFTALQQMAVQAQAAGDTDQLYAINEAMQQLSGQMVAMGDNGLNQRRLFDTGIYEMVGNTPYELTGDQAAAGGLPTLEGEMEPVPQNARLSEIRAALTQANGGKANAQLLRFIPEFSAALAQGPDAVQAVINKYDNARSTLRPEVLETADQLAATYRTQDINAMALEGASRAQPGVAVGQAPLSFDTEAQMRERNTALQEAEARAAGQQELTGAIADNDARVAGGQQQRSAQARREVLDSVLDGSQNAGNARNRFIKALRKAGMSDTMVRPDEQQVIDRYFGAREAFVDQDPDVLPSTPNEMGDMVPERKAPTPVAPTRPARTNENRSFQLTPPPSTDADLAAQEKAQAKRARKAGEQEAPAADEPATNRGQGILFTQKGKPSAAADQQRPAPAPRKSRVKVKLGEQEAELEVDDAPAKIEALKKDIDKFERFVKCLRSK